MCFIRFLISSNYLSHMRHIPWWPPTWDLTCQTLESPSHLLLCSSVFYPGLILAPGEKLGVSTTTFVYKKNYARVHILKSWPSQISKIVVSDLLLKLFGTHQSIYFYNLTCATHMVSSKHVQVELTCQIIVLWLNGWNWLWDCLVSHIPRLYVLWGLHRLIVN